MKYVEDILLIVFAVCLVALTLSFFIFYGYSLLHNRECIDGILKQKHNGSNGVYYVNVIDDKNTIQCEVK